MFSRVKTRATSFKRSWTLAVLSKVRLIFYTVIAPSCTHQSFAYIFFPKKFSDFVSSALPSTPSIAKQSPLTPHVCELIRIHTKSNLVSILNLILVRF